MKIVETTKEIIKWFKLIKERRETDLILDNKSYALFSAVAGIVAGVLIGIIIAIVQMALGSNDDTILSIVLSIALVSILAYTIWMTYPLLIDKSANITSKIVAFLITLIVAFASFLLGVYGVIFILVVVIGYWVLRIGLNIMSKS